MKLCKCRLHNLENESEETAMERRKLTKEDIDKVRNIEGFPIGTDEDIIALSDAPFYTACPNPFIEDFIKEYGIPYDEATDDYHREPFAADVSEGKTDPIYMAHTYHTKEMCIRDRNKDGGRMGRIIQYRLLQSENQTGLMRPVVYCDEKYCESLQQVSLNEKMATLLIKIKPERRTMRLERCFQEVLTNIPENSCIRDFDVLFNPAYKIDVLQLLTVANRSKSFSVLWPGTMADGKLVYAEDGYADYKEYDVEQYDITCVV